VILGPDDGHLAHVREQFPAADLKNLEDGSRLIQIPGMPLADGWNRRTVDVAFVASPAYPVAAPDSFFTEPDLRLADGSIPANTGFQSLPGANVPWLWFSYHSVGWAPQRGTYLAYARVIQARLATLR
jgi:hypothetical protein